MLETLPELPPAHPSELTENVAAGEVAAGEVAEPGIVPGTKTKGFLNRTRARDGRLGKVLARRRPFIFAPLFAGAVALTLHDHARAPLGFAVGASVALAAAWLVRIWATGYRTWVRAAEAFATS